ncbi:hypothetical protein JCM8097_009352 [Rhodosporidiobolus ruineniae]
MPSRPPASRETLSRPYDEPEQARPAGEAVEVESGTTAPGKLWGSQLVLNEGSTARDYLARERNFLSYIKLATTLAIISASLLIRFQFGRTIEMPRWEVEAEVPLGVLFFAATLGSLIIGTYSFYTSATGYSEHRAFVYAGKAVDVFVVGIGLLTVAACVLLLAGSDA